MKPKCHYCDQPATSSTQPPMCPKHLDLAVIAGYLTAKERPVTVESVTAALRTALDRGAHLDLTIEEVGALMQAGYPADYEVNL